MSEHRPRRDWTGLDRNTPRRFFDNESQRAVTDLGRWMDSRRDDAVLAALEWDLADEDRRRRQQAAQHLQGGEPGA